MKSSDVGSHERAVIQNDDTEAVFPATKAYQAAH